MASAPIIPSYHQPIYRQPARPAVRIALIAGEAEQAVDAALSALPVDSRELTLEELSFRTRADEVISTARDVLSPAMFTAFLRWGEAASHFCTRYETDEEGDERCDRNAEAIALAGATPCKNVQDAFFLNYLLTVEAIDTPAFGCLTDADADDTTLARLSPGVVATLRWASPLIAQLDALAAAAWRASPKRLGAMAVEVGSQITAAFRAARQAKGSHAVWLQERNDLIVETNDLRELTDADYDRAMARMSELETLILETPATTREDMVAQLLLATQITAEGSTINEDRAIQLVRRSMSLIHMGTLAGAVRGAVQ